MIRIILMLLLLGLSNSAMAEWSSITGTEIFMTYANLATIHKAGNMVQMLSLIDFKKPETYKGKLYMSMEVQAEYDCKEDKVRVLLSSMYSKNMAGGKVIGTDNNSSNWIPVPPHSFNKHLWKIACEKQIENSYMSIAIDASQKGNFPEAFSLLAKAREKAPENYLVYFLTGMTYIRKDDLNQAKPYLKKSIGLAKHMVLQDQHTKADMAVAYAFLGDSDNAKSFAEEAKKLFSEAGDADGVNKMNAFLLQIQKN